MPTDTEHCLQSFAGLLPRSIEVARGKRTIILYSTMQGRNYFLSQFKGIQNQKRKGKKKRREQADRPAQPTGQPSPRAPSPRLGLGPAAPPLSRLGRLPAHLAAPPPSVRPARSTVHAPSAADCPTPPVSASFFLRPPAPP
ncbi:hypothetical protein U9M48_003850 [Paspalum notatum var. saurae]|uniref:Uncharacterized protein n=1 Tax=Paspalum notatum var. saurae TaxID=547442 RepID=A0AAQ3SK78_PASNO